MHYEEEFVEVFPARKGLDTRGPLCHKPAMCPHGSRALLGLVLLSCFPSQARGESLNPFSKKQQLNRIQVCHFSAKRPASHLLNRWTSSFSFGFISSRVWKHCQAAISPPAVSSTCLQSPSIVLELDRTTSLIPVLKAFLLGCFKAHPECAGFMGKFSV